MAIYQVDNTINQIPLKNGYVYCISSIHNIKSILERGFRTPKKLQTQFAQLINNKPLDEYICFYFNPRNSLLYSRQKTYGDDIVILEIKKEILLLNNVIFTNKSVKASNFCFADEIKDLLNPNFINWDEVFATSWNDANENVKNEKKFKMMAEVLVPDMVPSAMIAGIVCQNPSVCEKVTRILNNNSINVSWNSSLFFNDSSDTTANQKREFKYHPQTKDELKALVDDEDIYLGDIDTSTITDMSDLFHYFGYGDSNKRKNFDGIELWNVSNVTDMRGMFYGCSDFNQPLSSWNVSNVTNMSGMFYDCKNFDQSLLKWKIDKDKLIESDVSIKCIVEIKNNKYFPYTKKELKALVNDESIYLGDIDTRAITDMSELFFKGFCLGTPIENERENFKGVEFWDVSNVTDMSEMFYCCKNFNESLNFWNVSNVTKMSRMFSGCKKFNQPLNSWNVSNVIDMKCMFSGCENFDQPLSFWDVSNVTDMGGLLAGCKKFNQPLKSWNVCKVTDISYMFSGCENFNQPLDSWDVSNVADMSGLFLDCKNFDQPLNSWNISNVTNTSRMFENCYRFNKPLNSWNVSNVTDMSRMFKSCWLFNQTLKSWNVSKVKYIDWMLHDCKQLKENLTSWKIFTINMLIETDADLKYIIKYENELFYPKTKDELRALVSNQNIKLSNIKTELITDMSELFKNSSRKDFEGISDWDVSNVTDMNEMFRGCNNFNEPLANWDVSQVKDMSGMFNYCDIFNQPLDSWNVSNVTDMCFMFDGCRHFNQPLDSWDVSNVTNMNSMFEDCNNFNQSLNSWNVSNVTSMCGMFCKCSMFNQSLNSWNVRNVTNMDSMFWECRNFNQPLNDWKVDSVVDMRSMFNGCCNFNQPLNFWNVSKVKDMEEMFCRCNNFDQSLVDWRIDSDTCVKNMFHTCKINIKNLPTLTHEQRFRI